MDGGVEMQMIGIISKGELNRKSPPLNDASTEVKGK